MPGNPNPNPIPLTPQVVYDQGQDIAERLTRSRSRPSASEKQYGGGSGRGSGRWQAAGGRRQVAGGSGRGRRDGGGGASDATKDQIICRVKSAGRATRTSPRHQ